jgi:hypothetical protein
MLTQRCVVRCSDHGLIPCSLVDKYLSICLSTIYKTGRRQITNIPSSVRTTYDVRKIYSRNGLVKGAMHFVRLWCHCRNSLAKSFPGIPHSNIVALRWLLGIAANYCHFRAFFSFGKKIRIAGTKLGE